MGNTPFTGEMLLGDGENWLCVKLCPSHSSAKNQTCHTLVRDYFFIYREEGAFGRLGCCGPH